MCGVRAGSPITPPRMATALRPICTTVKKLPGWACKLSTRNALGSPSLTSISSRILREAAREISAQEKKALITTSKRINKRLAKKLIFYSLKIVMSPFSPASLHKSNCSPSYDQDSPQQLIRTAAFERALIGGPGMDAFQVVEQFGIVTIEPAARTCPLNRKTHLDIGSAEGITGKPDAAAQFCFQIT